MLMYYGHETSAELLISCARVVCVVCPVAQQQGDAHSTRSRPCIAFADGFAPTPNPADYTPLYSDLRELLDDDRWTPRESARVTRAKAELLYSSDAAQAPLAVRPGGAASAAHLLGCLRVVHADAADVLSLEECMDAAVGHLTWQWRDASASDAAVQARRARADAAAVRHARERARELLDELPTSLEEDEALEQQLIADEGALHDGEEEDDAAASSAAAALLAAVRFRCGVKRLLAGFLADTAGALVRE